MEYVYNMCLMEKDEKGCFSHHWWQNKIILTRKTNLVNDTRTKINEQKMDFAINKMIQPTRYSLDSSMIK